MHLPKFEYFQPSTVEDAIHFLEIQKSGARLAAGGTDLYPRMKYGLTRPESIISLRDIPVTPPTLSQDGILNLDAFMPIKDVVSSRVILDNAPLLSEAADRVASEEIRNMATLGGNLCQESRCLITIRVIASSSLSPVSNAVVICVISFQKEKNVWLSICQIRHRPLCA